MELFHIEIKQYKKFLKRMDVTVRAFIGVSEPFYTKFTKKVPQYTVPEKDTYIFLPYLGKFRFQENEL